MSVTVVSIGSGSSGNALLVRNASTSLLVDCGMGPRTIEGVLRANGLSWQSLTGLVISHEHSDHVKALPTAIRKGVPIFSTNGTAAAARMPGDRYRSIFECATVFGPDLSVRPIVISHDAAEPCGFDITIGETHVCVITDTGQALDHFLEPIRRADLLILESNHDERMLWRGPYPQYLKARVASSVGHLSNGAAGELLRTALEGVDQMPEVWLGHLSETNNRPELAIATVRQQLGPLADEVRVSALSRYGGHRWASGAVVERPVRNDPRQLRMLEFE